MSDIYDGIHLKKRWFSKTHRREYIYARWLERLGQEVLKGIAQGNPKAFRISHAIVSHLEANQKFYGVE